MTAAPPLPREELRVEHPDWWNAPVNAMGDPDAWLAIIGLAPGKHGANRTGRPFTGATSQAVCSENTKRAQPGSARDL